jgi:hypothetical protein
LGPLDSQLSISVCSCLLLLLGKEAQRQSHRRCRGAAQGLCNFPQLTVQFGTRSYILTLTLQLVKAVSALPPSSIHIHIHINIHTTCASFNSIPIQFTRSFELRCTPLLSSPLHTLLTFLPRLRSPQGISPTPEVERLPGRLQGSPY